MRRARPLWILWFACLAATAVMAASLDRLPDPPAIKQHLIQPTTVALGKPAPCDVATYFLANTQDLRHVNLIHVVDWTGTFTSRSASVPEVSQASDSSPPFAGI